jgi:hypothetical protein
MDSTATRRRLRGELCGSEYRNWDRVVGESVMKVALEFRVLARRKIV